MDLQGSFRRTTPFVFIEYRVTFFWVSNYYDAISFSRLKIKPVKSKRRCEKLNKSSFPFKIICITSLFKLTQIAFMGRFQCGIYWVLS